MILPGTNRVEDFDPRSAEVLQTHARSTTAIIAFTVLAFAWSWGIGLAAKLVDAPSTVLTAVLMAVAGFGPSVAGLAVVTMFSRGEGLRHWLARCLNPRVGWRWFVLGFLGPPAVMVCALAMHAALGGTVETPPAAHHIPLAIVNFGLVLLIGGPLGEEFGWRGYAMPALAARMNWRAASLIIGVVWGLWHLPLFFMAGTAQSQMSIPVFLLNILAGSVLFGWLWQRTQASVLPALVLHTSLNAWAGILIIIPTAATARPYLLVTGLLVAVAIVSLFCSDAWPASQRRRSSQEPLQEDTEVPEAVGVDPSPHAGRS
ncbi:MAG: CPBP family intramembrane metalloprotease [Alphaproteobacteria bacterium]|nr:MAG: CPBP family intramembrane metalloprotease [Alphaproteobacteria bacterium]PZO35499.1 MAG: CPBP family intramembrane metalloprotease [Alphaproteobacteria bacterium]